MNRSSYASRLKVCAILKLVELNAFDTSKLKISKKQRWLPLSPDEFNVYAYPEYRHNGIESAEELDHKPKLDSSFNSAIEQEKINFNNNEDVIHDEKYIENLHHEIDKQARLEFSKQMQNHTDNTLREILNSLEESGQEIVGTIKIDDNKPTDTSLIVKQDTKPIEEKLVIKESLQPIANMKTNVANAESPIISKVSKDLKEPEISSTIPAPAPSNTLRVQGTKSDNIEDNSTNKDTQSEVKFTISIDHNEQDKYYTDVLDAVDKLFDKKDGRQFKTMTEIVDEIIEAEIKDNKKN